MIYEAPPPRSHQKAGEAPMADRQSISGLRATRMAEPIPTKQIVSRLLCSFSFLKANMNPTIADSHTKVKLPQPYPPAWRSTNRVNGV